MALCQSGRYPYSHGVEEGLSVSMICVKDGEVGKFDYISEANLLGIMDMDDEEVAPVFIPFRKVWKILPKDVFTPLDELQYLRKGEVTLDMVHEMMERARHLQPNDLHYKPTYPGAGFDEAQHTFILMWNPNISSLSLGDHIWNIANMYAEYFNWSVWEHEKAKCGDRFFLVCVGKGDTGIVMSGVLILILMRPKTGAARGSTWTCFLMSSLNPASLPW